MHDLPPSFNMFVDQAGKFLDDFHEVTLPYVQEILADAHTLVVDDHGYALGVIWFDDTVGDLHTTMHVLFRPEAWRAVIRQNILPKAATHAFKTMGVGKLLAFPMRTQKTAIKVLRKYKFYEHKPWYKHTRYQGIKVDIIMFELRKKYWEKQYEQWC